MMEENKIINLEKFGFSKAEKNLWVGWNDYYIDDIRSDYPYYLRASVHVPRGDGDMSNYRNTWKIVLHRYKYDVENIPTRLEEGESKLVYEGLIDNEEWFEQLLIKVGVK